MAFIYPMQTIGILGGGMRSYHLALAAKQMGFKVALLTSVQEPALSLVDYPTVGDLNDPKVILDFVNGLSTIIYQDEMVNAQTLETLAAQNYLPQGTDILAITQDRYLEKTFLDDLNLNVAPYTTVVNPADVKDGLESIGYPAVIKPIQKGLGRSNQDILYCSKDIQSSGQYLENGSAILESWIPVEHEFLIMACKDQAQNIQLLPIIETIYDGAQLIAAFVAPRIDTDTQAEIQRIARLIGEHVNYCGIFGVSFFTTQSGNLYTQRIFPGVHEAADVYQTVTGISQYELLLRCLSGWPMPEVTVKTNGAMLMILKIIEAQSYTQIKIKPDWHFEYYPVTQPVGAATPIGQIYLSNPSQVELFNRIRATELWPF